MTPKSEFASPKSPGSLDDASDHLVRAPGGEPEIGAEGETKELRVFVVKGVRKAVGDLATKRLTFQDAETMTPAIRRSTAPSARAFSVLGRSPRTQNGTF
jgi:hypothetical protein